MFSLKKRKKRSKTTYSYDWNNKNLYSVAVVGDGAVGKSSITIQFIHGKFIDEYDPTIEDSYRRQITVDDHNCVLDILDTAGQEEYAAMRDQYMRITKGFIMVYDVTCIQTLYKLAQLYHQLVTIKDTKTIPIVFVANKCDLHEERIKGKEGVPIGLALGIIRDMFGISSPVHIECSALTNQGVDEVFREIVREIRKYNPGMGAYVNEKTGCNIL